MKVLVLTAEIIFIGLLDLTVIIGHVAASYEPFGNNPPRHHPMEGMITEGKIARCSDCHLVKQPPDPCKNLIGRRWENCVDFMHRYPDGD